MARKVALLLEDEAMIAIEVESSLKDEGFDGVTFDTCGAALDWLVSNDPALAIVAVEIRDGACDPAVRMITQRGITHVIN